MKHFKKMVLLLAMLGATVSALAANVVLTHDGEARSYSYTSMLVDETGEITVSLSEPWPAELNRACGTDTIVDPENGDYCIADPDRVGGGGMECGLGTEPSGSECVPAVAPTVTISSNPSSMGDDVSTATLTFQFDRPVTGFAANDVSASGSHTITGFNAISDTLFRATLNRSGNSSGSITVTVNGNGYKGKNGANGTTNSRTINLTGGSTNVGNCVVPDNVVLNNSRGVTTFGKPQGLIDFSLPRAPAILSGSFKTTGNSSISGEVKVSGNANTDAHTRRMWISDCPGGAPLSRRCEAESNMSNMKWTQGSGRTSCQLDVNSTYYFNIAYPSNSSTCRTSTCAAIIQNLGGW